jgi:cytoskeletal protein CcmA (bactofilin family)
MSHRTRIVSATVVAAILIVLFATTVGASVAAQTVQRIANLISEKITVTNNFDSRGTATLAQATITNLTAPTVTMTSATTWTVSSLTADVALSAAALDAATLAVSGNSDLTGKLVVTGTSNLIGAVTTNGAMDVGTTSRLRGAITADGALGVAGASTLHGLTVHGNALITGTTDIDGATTITGAVNALSTVDVVGDLEVTQHLGTQAELYLWSGDPTTLLDGGIITPTNSLYEIDTASDITVTLATAADGHLLVIANSDNYTVTIVDTGTTRLAGNATLGQYDTLTLIGLGTSWYEVSRSSN